MIENAEIRFKKRATVEERTSGKVFVGFQIVGLKKEEMEIDMENFEDMKMEIENFENVEIGIENLSFEN
ncbi:hypothetical protein AgCh_035346 [Apium graveolens]